MTSTKTLSYDPEAVTYLKKQKGESDPADAYQAVPGLIGDSIPQPQGAQVSFNECKYQCTAGTFCRSFVYIKSKKACIPSGDSAAFDPAWTFFEKNYTPDQEKENQHRADEHAFKDRLKKEWLVQNNAEQAREKLQKKELATKCHLNDIEDLKMSQKNAAATERDSKKRLADIVARSQKFRSAAQLHQEGYLRFKTATMKFSINKELKQKEGMKLVNPKRVKEVFTKVDELRSEHDRSKAERDAFQKKVTNDKLKSISLWQERQEAEKGVLLRTEDEKMYGARIVIAVAEHQEKCGAQKTADLAAQLMQEKEATAQAKQIARDREREALSLQQSSEKANKAMIAENSAGDNNEAESNAHRVAQQAEEAAAESKAAAKEELKDATKKDELQMEVKNAKAQQHRLKLKAYEARTYLNMVEKRRQTAMIQETNEEAATPA